MKNIKTILLGSFLLGAVLFTGTSVSALTYQESVDVQFTFNPTITISLSSADLVISNLAPGSYADSNIITVIASTNNPTGYTLYATAGNGTTYTNTNLINGNNNFTSVATNASLASMDSADPNKWAFSFSSNSGSTWSNYSGLPYYTNTGKTLVSSNSNTTDTIQFKIGAKASSDQPSGEYRNIVNFVAVTNAVPTLDPNLTISAEDIEYNSDAVVEVSTESLATGQVLLSLTDYDGSNVSTTSVELVNGNAEWTICALSPGSYSVTAQYLGDSNYYPAEATTTFSISTADPIVPIITDP